MKYSHPLIALTGLLILWGCNPSSGAKDEVIVATIDGKNITQTEFNTFATLAAGSNAAPLNEEQRQQILDRLIGIHLAADAAEKAKLQDQPETAASLALWRTNLLSDAQLKKQLADQPITDEEIKAEYDAQVAALPKQYRARHILVDNKEAAEKIIGELQGGADFAKLAKDKSKDPGSAKNGGDLDWFSPDSMVKPFSEAVAKLQDGQITQEPVQSQFGWHVIKLEGSRSQAVPPLEDVKSQVKNLVQNKRIESYLAELRKNAKVEVKPLPSAAPAAETSEAAATPAAPATEGAAAPPAGANEKQ